MLTLGSLCTGIGGLELGLRLAGYEFTTEFVADIDPGCSEWLEVNEEAINLGDFTKLDRLPETDILVAGFPCQPVSTAGKKRGTDDDRWLWRDIYAHLERAERLPVLCLENVRALLTANGGGAFAEVCHSLADLGYRFSWGTLRASAVGAPHRRDRWWGLAYPADTQSAEWAVPKLQRVAAPAGQAAESRERDRTLADRFGPYAPAIGRWERIIGRHAPDPLDDGKINPRFVEFQMGYPEGWVTDTILDRGAALKALGNAVVPQCAAAAYGQLAQRMTKLGLYESDMAQEGNI